MNKSIFLLLSVLFCLPAAQCLEKLDLTIRYLGLPVVDVVMTDDGRNIDITAKATPIASIAARMNNRYISTYSGSYLTDSYRKIIRQKDYREDRITHYDRTNLTARRISYIQSDKNLEYDITAHSRDFFAALYYMRLMLNSQAQGELRLDANAMIWKAEYELIGREEISSGLGKQQAIIVKFSFQQISAGEKENSDMLTNNLVNEDRFLLFWFSDDERKIPLKAKFVMKPFPVIWRLENYTIE